nr:hypothetical protein [Tanacetum cinerariifolium]
MLNKENYVSWSSRLLRYAKTKPNGKLIYNSKMNGLYVRRMIPEPDDPDHEVPIAETFYEQTNDELTEKEVKKIEDDDQAIYIILMGLSEDIYIAVDRDLEEIEEVNANCIWMANMQQASTSGTQTGKASIYDLDGSAQGYTEEIMHGFEQRLEMIFERQVNRVHTLDFKGLTLDMRQDLAERMWMLGGAGRSMTRRQFILALDLHTAKEMTKDGFEAYWHAEGRKSDVMLSGGHLIRRIAHHFGLLVKLNIYMEIRDDWAWVAQGMERQPVVVSTAPGSAEDTPDVDEGAQAVLAPIHAPLPPPLAASRTMPQRLGRLEEDIQGLLQDVRSLRGLVERSMTDQGRFSTWIINCMA